MIYLLPLRNFALPRNRIFYGEKWKKCIFTCIIFFFMEEIKIFSLPQSRNRKVLYPCTLKNHDISPCYSFLAPNVLLGVAFTTQPCFVIYFLHIRFVCGRDFSLNVFLFKISFLIFIQNWDLTNVAALCQYQKVHVITIKTDTIWYNVREGVAGYQSLWNLIVFLFAVMAENFHYCRLDKQKTKKSQ